MNPVVCVYCENQVLPEQPFCGRCGGSPGGESVADQALSGLMRIERLIHQRVWFGLEDEIKVVHRHLTDPEVDQASEPAIRWVVDAVDRLIHERDIPRAIKVGKLVFANLARRKDYPEVYRGLRRLVVFAKALEQANQEWSEPEPFEISRRQAYAWLAEQATPAGLTVDQAFESVYETPDRWPVVAETIDPEASQLVHWKVELAQAKRLLKEKHHRRGRAILATILLHEPACAEAYECLGLSFKATGRTDRAIDAFRSALETGTASPSVGNNLAWSLATEGTPTPIELEEALWAIRWALARAPRAVCWDTLAEILGQKGDWPGALAATREAIRLDPGRTIYRDRMRAFCATLTLGPVPGTDFELVAQDDLRPVLPGSMPSDSLIPRFDPDDDTGEFATQGSTHPLDDSGEFSRPESDSASEVFALDPDEVDQNAANAMARVDDDDDLDDLDDDESGVGESEWDFEPKTAPVSKPPEPVKAAPSMDRGASSPLSGLFRRILGPIRQAVSRPKAQTITDRVQFSMTAPSTLEPGGSYAVDVWAYLEARRSEVMALARESQGTDAIRVKTKSGVVVDRGVVVTVRLAIPSLTLTDPEDSIDWDGRIGNVTFPVGVPMEARPGPHPGTATFHVGDLRIAKLHFVLEVGQGPALVAPLAAREVRCKCAFASYASEDRDEVLGRLQGIMKVLPDLDLFLDVASLRSGDRWEERLYQEIARRDTLYLFWSEAASRSVWVEREWRTALGLRGIAGIDPVPLVSPDTVPPPVELAEHLHFNDWLLAFRRTRRETSTGPATAPSGSD